MTDNFFGGAPTLSWSRKTEGGGYVDREELRGKIRGGVIVEITGQQQATDMVSGKPAWWEPPQGDNPGRPKLQYVLTLRCDGSRGGALDERTPGVANDTGDRRLFIPDGDMRKAVGDAFRANGARGLQVGDELYLAWTGYRPSKIKGGKPAKTWASRHVKGTPPEQQWAEEGASVPADASAGAGSTGNPFAPLAAPGGPGVVHGNGPQQGQSVTGAGSQPPANPFGGPLPDQPPAAQQVANPFA